MSQAYVNVLFGSTLRSLIDGRCGIVGGVLEKILKANSQGAWNSSGVEKAGKCNNWLRGEFRFPFLSFLTIKTTYCRTFYIQ